MTVCTKCGERKHHAKGLCGKCYTLKWKIDNRARYRAEQNEHARRKWFEKHGSGMRENRYCPAFLGIHVAEQILCKVFKDVEMMPTNNVGYDFVCNTGMKIDVKSSILHERSDYAAWEFNIRRNTIADYFLCIAFDNRDDLTPLHLWLIPSELVNCKFSASISRRTIHKWDEYALEIDKVISCCNKMKKGVLNKND